MNPRALYRYFASAKFAIPALIIFACAMVYGTICESRFGGEFARIAVYQSWWFYLIQGWLAVSLILSVTMRLPLRKRLFGFYLIHASIILLILGSEITRRFGIDGTIELNRDEMTDSIRLSDEAFLILEDRGQKKQQELPRAVRSTELNRTLELSDGKKLNLLKYFPYAKPSRRWQRADGAWSSSWNLKNQRANQSFEISNDLNSTIPSHIELGLLMIDVVDPQQMSMMEKYLPSKTSPFLLIDKITGQMESLDHLDHPRKTKDGNVISLYINPKLGITAYHLKTKQGLFRFFPKFSVFPIDQSFQPDSSSRYMLLNFSSYRDQSTLLVSPSATGKIRLGFGKGSNWQFLNYENDPISLPWMGFKLTLQDQVLNKVPVATFVEAVPSSDEKDNMKALLAELDDHGQKQLVWFDSRSVHHGNSELAGIIGPRFLHLPFTLSLERFQMQQVRGTDKPASYESFVRSSNSSELIHIYMNHPFKALGFTFYQSSYLQDEDGQYHSILSINKDPGRPIKYLASLLLVMGLILHFLIIYGYIQFNEKSK